MTTRCKFKCDRVTQLPDGAAGVELSAVTNGSDENKAFWKWTPGGTLRFHTINATAAAQFKPGQEYYLDISAAAKEPA